MGESRARRTAGSLAFVVLLTCLATGLFLPPARASCIGPQIAAGPSGTTPTPYQPGSTASPPVASVAAGQGMAVAGDFFLDGCDDSVGCTAGCGGCQSYDPAEPLRGVQLVLVAGARETVLGEVDSDDAGSWRTEVALPSDAPPGPARIEARSPFAPEELQVLATAEVTLT
ncbi:MAG: hypothetical protein AB7O74_15215 [Candidatus Nanopelagicales bacterium]